MRQELPLTLTAAPQPEGEVRTFSLQSGDVPGLRFADATLTKTLTGYKFQLPFAVVDEKAVELIHVKDLLATTGYIRGGCSPIGMKKPFPTYLDETAQLYDEIGVSAGQRGCQILLAPEDLINYVNCTVCDLTE